VYFLYVITCCGEIVTPSALFINHVLSTAMAMLSNKWQASYDNISTEANGKKHFVWVQKAADRPEAAYCKLYHCNILPRISNFSNHEILEKHKWRTLLQDQTRLNVRKTPRQDNDIVKAIELGIAVSMTCHCAIRTVDHLSEITITHGHERTLEHIKLRSSKCGRLIKNIISPALKTDLIDDFQIKKYAIILDESTDISTQKHLYERKEIVTGFIVLIPVQDATGEKIFNLVDE